MDAWLSQNYRTVILVLSVLLGWQLFNRLVPSRAENRLTTATSFSRSPTAGYTVIGKQGESGYSISSAGKRHNSGCRYYNPSKPCGPGDGTPCKICGAKK